MFSVKQEFFLFTQLIIYYILLYVIYYSTVYKDHKAHPASFNEIQISVAALAACNDLNTRDTHFSLYQNQACSISDICKEITFDRCRWDNDASHMY